MAKDGSCSSASARRIAGRRTARSPWCSMRFGGSRLVLAAVVLAGCRSMTPALQQQGESINKRLRAKSAIAAEQTDVGLLDLQNPNRVATIPPDHEEYAASVAKVGILYAW